MGSLDSAPADLPPRWVQDAVFYQIFPDRFARSSRVVKPTNLISWEGAPSADGFHGGDLLGVCEHLDHLLDLGVNALYLTPIFRSAANHRYHTHDYYQVDPILGGNAALRELVESAHAVGIRVILDGVFNHASRGFFQFHDILENGPHSPWLDWFQIRGWPLVPYDGGRPANYEAWAHNRALPKFNTDNPAVREFLMGVGEHWIREYDIDGWRLDVPAEIRTPGFWEEFRSRVRAIKADAYLVGEIWREADEWLRGDRFDATMNYRFAAAAIALAGGQRVSQTLVNNRPYDPYPGIDAAQYARRVAALIAEHRWSTVCAQLNLLDSHDAPRVISVARGDRATLCLATLLQMTFPGAPCVYYGDEIALRGTKRYDRPHRDQDARWLFPWHDRSVWDHDVLQHVRGLIALRRRYAALRTGEFLQVLAEGAHYALLRRDAVDTLLVVLNVSETGAEVGVPVQPHVRNGASLEVVFGGAGQVTADDGQVRVHVPARSGLVLHTATQRPE